MATIESAISKIEAISDELIGRSMRISLEYIYELGDAVHDKSRASEFDKELCSRIKRGCDDLIDKMCEISGAHKSFIHSTMNADTPGAVEFWRKMVAA